MKTGFYTFSFLLCTALGLLCPPPAEAAGDAFRPGQVIRYEGKTRISQKVGEEKPQGDSFKGTLLSISEASPKGVNTILAVRELVPEGGEGSPIACFDILESGRKYGLKARETATELENAHQMIGIYLPLRLQIPPVKPGNHEVLILNQIPVSIECSRSYSRDADEGQVVSTMSNAGKVSFDFRGNKATLNSWKESYTSSRKTGLVSRISIDYEMSVTINGNKITLSLDCDLEAKEVTTLEKTPLLQKGLAAFRKSAGAFKGMKPSSETRPLVDETGKLLDKSPWSALARAARTQLDGFVETFEADDAGKILAKILGKPAPDFTLAGLDGKQVNFRKETAGKVTLLSFWGYG